MKPKKIQIVDKGNLLIDWDDNTNSKIRLIDLRKYCPCAICGENREHHQDWSHVFFTSHELTITEIKIVGQYALNIIWADGHNTGIYEFNLLKKMNCEESS
ncbi:MAG: hypothetical protein Fur0015_03070 [Ignavibacteriales bacterium]